MYSNNNFNPEWADPPGSTIKELMQERALTPELLISYLQIDIGSYHKLITGDYPIDNMISEKLAYYLGATPSFWLTRENNYRQHLNRVTTERNNWLNSLPTTYLKNYHYITANEPYALFKECLRFFGISGLNEWDEKYKDKLLIASFRTSNSFDSNAEAVITWLRVAELQVVNDQIANWNALMLTNSLSEIRKLTRVEEPNDFLPKLKEILNSCGVSLAIVKNVEGCRASGATYFLSENRALIVLSFRYLSDDHFWFSLFHEIGHLLLHGNKGLFLEGITSNHDEVEEEANQFAANTLIPKEHQNVLRTFSIKNWKKIVRFAKQIGVSPGIVVGQLQHKKILSYSSLNKLKVRYKWD